jgi:hypothetical protein
LILYLKDPPKKNSTRKTLDLINTCSKIAGYKTNKQKSLAFLYANTELAEKGIRKIIPFTIAQNLPRNKPNQGGERPLQ